MPSDVPDRVATLRSLIRLLNEASETVIREWEAEDAQVAIQDTLTKAKVPSRELFDAQRTLVGACNMCIDIVDDPFNRIYDINLSVATSRALYIVIEAGIPDILDDVNAREGVSVSEISHRTTVNEADMARVLRLLATRNVFVEVRKDHFVNTRIGKVFVKNKAAQSLVLLFGSDSTATWKAFQHLPDVILRPPPSGSTRIPFQRAAGGLSYFDYLEQQTSREGDVVSGKNAYEIFSMAMKGYNQHLSPPLVTGFPWASLGAATVVDVGGGVGSMTLDLASAFPDLHYVVQDLPPVVEQARAVWQTEHAGTIESGHVQLMAHDFFKEQPVVGAEVYLLRWILHNWSEDNSVAILSRIAEAMGPRSRILVAEMILHPATGSPYLADAPKPLPANYGYPHFFKNAMDICMFTLFDAMERTPEQYVQIAERAGLVLEKVWNCCGPLGIIELRKR